MNAWKCIMWPLVAHTVSVHFKLAPVCSSPPEQTQSWRLPWSCLHTKSGSDLPRAALGVSDISGGSVVTQTMPCEGQICFQDLNVFLEGKGSRNHCLAGSGWAGKARGVLRTSRVLCVGWSTEEVGDTLPDALCLCEGLKQGTLTPRSGFSLSCLCLPLQQAHCCRPKHFWELWQKEENQ